MNLQSWWDWRLKIEPLFFDWETLAASTKRFIELFVNTVSLARFSTCERENQVSFIHGAFLAWAYLFWSMLPKQVWYFPAAIHARACERPCLNLATDDAAFETSHSTDSPVAPKEMNHYWLVEQKIHLSTIEVRKKHDCYGKLSQHLRMATWCAWKSKLSWHHSFMRHPKVYCRYSPVAPQKLSFN